MLAIAASGRANESSANPPGPDAQGHHGMMGNMSSMMGMMGMMDDCERMMSGGSRTAPNEQWRLHREPRPGKP
ncbi:MAG: hypothetical protein ACREEP_15880 [Dongiaceae bacterium]